MPIVLQVALRWGVQRQYAIVPKSVTPSRIKENFEVCIYMSVFTCLYLPVCIYVCVFTCVYVYVCVCVCVCMYE